MIPKLTSLINNPKIVIPLLVMLFSYPVFSVGNTSILEVSTHMVMDVDPIKGKVVDANGEALIGVTVLVQGRARGTVTFNRCRE